MHTCLHWKRSLSAIAVVGGALLAAVPFNSYGDPPAWAPAHGWRKKNDRQYVGYTGRKWDHDYGIIGGYCNREAVGAVLGGVAGGMVGSQIGNGGGRKIAILAGTVAGAVIGAQIGRDMDRTDRACIAHALELTATNERVNWVSPDNRTTYVLTPVRGFKHNGQICREFDLRTTRDRRTEFGRGRACQSADGAWRIVG